MTDLRADEVISAPLATLLDLFSSELPDVKFPNLEAATLREAAEGVLSRRDDLARAEAEVEAARLKLEASQDALLALGQRALAYARVYAEDHAGLSARLEAIALPRGLRRIAQPEASPVAPRRKRGARSGEPGVPLFAEEAASAQAGQPG